MTLRVLLVDDEELARLRLRTLLADCLDPPARVAGEAASAAAALDWLARHEADVLLLDIHMPGLSGLELARRLHQLPQRPALIFVTAHAEHALAAFEVEAVDYLTKPVRRLRLQEALGRAARQLGGRLPPSPPGADAAPTAATASAAPVAAPGAPADHEPALVVPTRQGLVRVPLQQLLYLKAEQKYLTVRTASAAYLIEASLTELEPRLGPRFVRIHRNALVARDAIRELRRLGGGPTGQMGLEPHEPAEGWAVCVDPAGEWLAVSRRQLAAVREALAGSGL
ncbi:MAG: hypothetical protein RJA44_203 [Pseudomonadota bacterium]